MNPRSLLNGVLQENGTCVLIASRFLGNLFSKPLPCPISRKPFSPIPLGGISLGPVCSTLPVEFPGAFFPVLPSNSLGAFCPIRPRSNFVENLFCPNCSPGPIPWGLWDPQGIPSVFLCGELLENPEVSKKLDTKLISLLEETSPAKSGKFPESGTGFFLPWSQLSLGAFFPNPSGPNSWGLFPISGSFWAFFNPILVPVFVSHRDDGILESPVS